MMLLPLPALQVFFEKEASWRGAGYISSLLQSLIKEESKELRGERGHREREKELMEKTEIHRQGNWESKGQETRERGDEWTKTNQNN